MTSTRKFSIAFGALLVMLFVSFLIFNSSTQFRSVEFGLVELSPRGPTGGYAMPASGASAPSGLQYSCASSGTSVSLSWSGSVYQGALPSDEKFAKANWSNWIVKLFTIPVAHAQGESGGWLNNLIWKYQNVEVHNHTVPVTPSYEVQISDLGTFSTNSTSYTASILPSSSYSWSVRACAGGGCSDWQTGDNFTCDAPPTLTFTADQYSVPYNTSTTLRWTSENTDSCTASGEAWSGSKSVSGNEPTSNITQQTTYLLQCSGPRGSTVPASATINVISGTDAEITIPTTVVRKDEIVELEWDVGTSDPQNCVVKAGSVTIDGPLTTTSGVTEYKVIGETEFSLSCDGGLNTDSVTVKVLPEFQET